MLRVRDGSEFPMPRLRQGEVEVFDGFRHKGLPETYRNGRTICVLPLRLPAPGCFPRGDGFDPRTSEAHLIAVPVLQVTLGVIVALFVIQMVRRLSAQSQNTLAQGVADGLGFLTAP